MRDLEQKVMARLEKVESSLEEANSCRIISYSHCQEHLVEY